MLTPDLHVVIQNALEQVRGTWRYRWVALAVAWSVAVLLWAGVFLIPDTYQASARVFVDTNTTLSEATRGISLGVDVDTQIRRVREALLGGPQLERVAEQTNLVSSAETPREKQVVLDDLRDAMDISGGISQGSATAGVFTISYKNHSRAKSLEVVSRLLNLFVEGTLGGKRQGSQQAQQFLVTQINDYEQRLSTAEQRLADFKRRNVGMMPGAQGDYFTRLQTAMDGLNKARESLGVALRKRQELERQLRGEPALVPGLDGGELGGNSSVVVSDTGNRIRETQAKLDDLLLRFTDKHPDVIALRQTLQELKARQQAEVEAVRRGDPGAAARIGLAANPVYQSIELQHNQAEVDIAADRQDIAERESKIAELRALMNTAPEVEAKFASLNRDYDVTREQFRALLERLDRARLGEQAEATGIVKFEIIDPPRADFAPIAPKRPKLIIAAFVLALAAGVGAAFLLHLLRPVFLSVRQLSAVVGFPVLGAVSMTWLEKYNARRRRGVVVYAGATAVLAAAAVMLVALHGLISQVVRGLLL
ncbi:MAG: XrtA system polysaccharide chain length determinant [Steroidobacteraceae bacterium]